MSFPAEFIFLRPWWLLLLPVGVLLAFAVTRKGTDSWNLICDPTLLGHLMSERDRRSGRLIRAVTVLTWTVAVVALAGPAWDREKADLFQNVDAMVVVFDLSRSMNSTDLLPSRLDRARYKAIEVVESEPDRAVGLVVFAGSAFDVVPVSDDVATVTHLLQSLQTTMMPVQGSRASEGIERARQLLKGSGYSKGSVVLVTDGTDTDAVDAARRLRNSGYSLSVIAVGTDAGAPLISQQGEFLRDATGEPVIVAVDHSRLARLAAAGGGRFSIVGDDAARLALQTSAYDLDEAGDGTVLSERWKDRGPYFLIFLLPLAALLFRRGWLLTVGLIWIMPTQPLFAFEWSDLWLRSDQRAARAVQMERYDDEVLQQHPQWSAVAHYRSNAFDQAATEFAKSDELTAIYNLGNALAMSGKIPDAIEQYEAALEIDPDFEDARFNLELLEQLLEQQQGSGESADGTNRGDRSSQSIESKEGGMEELPDRADQGDRSDRADEADLSRRSGQQALGGQESEQEETVSEQSDSKEQISLQADLDEEMIQVMEQWLRRIPDDPGGLLRRKFHLENLLRGEAAETENPW